MEANVLDYLVLIEYAVESFYARNKGMYCFWRLFMTAEL